MKKENTFYLIAALIILISAAAKLLHLPYAWLGEILSPVIIALTLIHLYAKNNQLKKKLAELSKDK